MKLSLPTYAFLLKVSLFWKAVFHLNVTPQYANPPPLTLIFNDTLDCCVVWAIAYHLIIHAKHNLHNSCFLLPGHLKTLPIGIMNLIMWPNAQCSYWVTVQILLKRIHFVYLCYEKSTENYHNYYFCYSFTHHRRKIHSCKQRLSDIWGSKRRKIGHCRWDPDKFWPCPRNGAHNHHLTIGSRIFSPIQISSSLAW